MKAAIHICAGLVVCCLAVGCHGCPRNSYYDPVTGLIYEDYCQPAACQCGMGGWFRKTFSGWRHKHCTQHQFHAGCQICGSHVTSAPLCQPCGVPCGMPSISTTSAFPAVPGGCTSCGAMIYGGTSYTVGPTEGVLSSGEIYESGEAGSPVEMQAPVMSAPQTSPPPAPPADSYFSPKPPVSEKTPNSTQAIRHSAQPTAFQSPRELKWVQR